MTNQGEYSIAIGNNAGRTDQSANSIILNADSVELNADSSGLYIAPIRNVDGISNLLCYDTTRKEIVYSSQTGGGESSNTISKFILGGKTNLTTNVSQLPITSRQFGTFTFTDFGVVTIPETALYRITASSLNQQSSGNARTEITLYLYVNGTENTETNASCYIRCQTGCDNASCHYTNIVLLNQNDAVTIRTRRTDNAGTGQVMDVLQGTLILERLN